MKHLWLIIFAFCSFATKGQDLFFKATNIIDSESEINVNAFVKDDQGFLWLASNDGLLFSNGDGYLRINILDSIADIEINTIYHEDGKLYLGLRSGLILTYSIDDRKVISTYDLGNCTIKSIVIDKGKNIWVGTSDLGLFNITEGIISLIDVNFGLADNVVNDILYDYKNNCIWVATDRGLSQCLLDSKNKIINYTSRNGLPDNLLTTLELDSYNKLWLGSYSGKLAVLVDEEIKVIEAHFNNSIIDFQQYQNEVICAVNNKGIYSLRTKGNLLESTDLIYSADEIKQIKILKENELLILAKESDLSISDLNIRFYSKMNGFDLNTTSALYTEANGKLLIANAQYILRKYPNDSLEVLIDLKKENISYVISLLSDTKGNLWFGTFDQGLFRLKNGVLENYQEESGLINNNVMTLHEWKNALWCGTLGGLSKVETLGDLIKFKNFSKNEGLDAAYIYQLSSTNETLYIASDGEGLFTYDENSFKKVDQQHTNSIYDLIIHSNDHLLLSADHGQIIELNKDKRDKIFSILNNGSPVDLAGIVQLDSSIVLFTWEQGFGLLNIKTGIYKLFNSTWGLTDFANDFLNVITQDDEGNICLGGKDYIIKVLSTIKEESLQPEALLRSVELFSTPLDTSMHSFSYQENHFSFIVNSLWLQDPKNIEYQYRLIGLDDQWLSTKDNVIVYPRLHNGEYRFELRAGLSHSLENAKISSYSFEIKNAYYSTWWFFLITALAFLTGVYGLIIYRDRKAILKKKMDYERVLSQFELLKSQINPHFLFNSLNTAYALIAKDTDDARNYLLSLSNYLRSILTKNQDHVISLSKELKFAENYTLLQKKRFGDNLLFDIAIDDESILESFIPPLTLQILLENAIKHNIISKTNPLKTQIYIDGEYIVVENNLQIRKRTGEGTKIGLSNIKSRYHILFDKEIIIDVTEESFIVKLPIIHSYVESITD